MPDCGAADDFYRKDLTVEEANGFYQLFWWCCRDWYLLTPEREGSVRLDPTLQWNKVVSGWKPAVFVSPGWNKLFPAA
jgi:hypothetical protein